MYDNIYLKTKIKSCYDKINANFHDKEIPKEGFHCVCLSLILMDSVFKDTLKALDDFRNMQQKCMK